MNKQSESEWWSEQRIITILTDSDSWILPWAERLAFSINENGDRAEVIYDIGKVKPVTFVLSSDAQGFCPIKFWEKTKRI